MGDAELEGWGDHPGALHIPDGALSDALNLALAVALTGSISRPRLAFPAALRPILRATHLSSRHQHLVRTAIESDEAFRKRVQGAASADLLDELGLAWLTRPGGWTDTVSDHLAQAATDPDLAAALVREQRRREAAQRVAMVAQAEVANLHVAAEAQQRRLDAVTAQLRDANGQAAKAAKIAAEVESALRRTEQRADRVAEQVALANDAVAVAVAHAREAESARDAALIARVQQVSAEPAARIDLSNAKALARQVVDALDAVELTGRRSSHAGQSARRGRTAASRKPIAVPGGLLNHSDAVTEHYLKTPGLVALVDGYNVAKLGWPGFDLNHQREACIDAAERVARRWGTNITVVFDGASVVGASAPGRRFVRVMFSPEGVLADDVLRDEVARLDSSVPVLVVTNDQEVLTSVRAAGANTIRSDQFLHVAVR